MKFFLKAVKTAILFLFALFIFLSVSMVRAEQVNFVNTIDSDNDGLPDELEVKYGTDSLKNDTDGDGYTDLKEISHGYSPLEGSNTRLPKRIEVDLSEQRLKYSYGEYGAQGDFLISSGIKKYPTPEGVFAVKYKQLSKLYKGKGYYYPNTKWNLNFFGSYFIHGAYWHNNFGKPMSHGCVNVSYKNMEGLYNFADVGTEIVIHE